MQTAIDCELLNTTVSLPDLTIGQAMDIAKIPERLNEKRISALIAHLSGDAQLAGRLTVQERYYVLLNHQMIANNKYSEQGDQSRYIMPTIQSEVPENASHSDLAVSLQHLRGKHVCVLESQCESLYDWLCGQMACQLHGELPIGINEDGSSAVELWEPISTELTESEINKIMQERVGRINDLPEHVFNYLVSIYNSLSFELSHFVDISHDDEGVTVLPYDAEGLSGTEPARFLALAALRGTAKRLAELATE